VRRSAAAAFAAALALAGCGGGKHGPPPPTLHAPRLPFTFQYPNDFRPSAPAAGPVLALVALDPRDALAVRRTSTRELDPDQYLAGLHAAFVHQGLRVVERRERHSGRDMGVLAVDVPASNPAAGGGARLHTTSYFFAGGGGTWQLECRATSRAVAVARACRLALGTLRFT
jgi:hypothetical protein